MLSLSSRIDIELELRRRALREEAHAKYHNNPAAFIKDAWRIVEPAAQYYHGWHIDAMCEHLKAVTEKQITLLAINVPPGMMKSLTVGVFWPSWEWGVRKLSHYRYLGVSHQQNLSIRDNLRMKRLVISDWYQNIWSDEVTLTRDQHSKIKFENLQTGFREAVAADSITGSRGDRVLIDDPISVQAANSRTILESCEQWFLEAVPTRLNNPKESAIILIMQRVNERDTTGLAIAKELGYTHLMLPMEFEKARKCVTVIGFEDPRTEENELLFPERFPQEVVDRDKKAMGEYAWAAQAQQRPTPRGGGIIKKDWFKFYEPETVPREFPIIIQAYDTAFKTGQSNDYTVGTTWGYILGKYYLLGRLKGRYEYPELVQHVKNQFNFYNPNAILIEDKASGQSLIQSLKRETSLPIRPIKVDADKETRVHAVSFLFESGVVYVPRQAWVADYIDVLTTFPNGAYDDDVDSTSMALNWLSKAGKGALKQHNADIFSR